MNILGVNEWGAEAANDTITDGRDLPWLQETGEEQVWAPWGITYRDVVILDGENLYFGAYNLTSNDLRGPAARNELLDLFRDAAATLP